MRKRLISPSPPGVRFDRDHRLDLSTERTLAVTDKVDGNLAGNEEIKISPDHNVLTMTIQSVGQTRPEIRVFDRE